MRIISDFSDGKKKAKKRPKFFKEEKFFWDKFPQYEHISKNMYTHKVTGQIVEFKK